MKPLAVCLMGPTASGKTDVAVALAQRLPIELISVDSALVYRGMDVGTAKPDPETLEKAPHRLIDIRDPEDSFSVGDFVRHARQAIKEIRDGDKLPLLVGGTMMYFRALTAGLADLPEADEAIRAELDEEAGRLGWPVLHERLAVHDPESAARINPNDSQRIQRALEVFLVSGRSLSDWQAQPAGTGMDIDFLKLGLVVEPRELLHERIEERLKIMLNNNLEAEVRMLMKREGLTREHSSMRSVGYRQFWEYLAGETSRDRAAEKTLYATRQLAKRQITWMRSEKDLSVFDALDSGTIDTIDALLAEKLP
ncbi:MAG: tRNA (adenosine(37)-N6)-dimethylallyltransferase MiaA [Woeseiaceae bacterium]|nr:tRNA (adenosine(37)-N6)-dimethylallyltransferase MiaA [Woeseiaceae bacterium]